MRKTAMLLLAVVGATLAISRTEPRASNPPARGPLEGTWQYTFVDEPGLADLKILNQDHFTWTMFNRATGEVVGTAGGTYTLKGNIYTEHVNYILITSPAYQELIGKPQVLTSKLKGHVWHISGLLSNGAEI